MKDAARQAFEAVEGELRTVSQWLYDHPETAYQEHESSARLAAFLAERGFSVEYPAWGLSTSFDATVGGDGPEVVICAEYDALPEIGHACGHNVIATAACGAGAALAPFAAELGVRVRVLGTPAEESYGGKVDLIDAGAFRGAAAAMMIHPAPHDVVDQSFLAVSHLDVDYHGKEAHASAAPQLGVNALDAAVQAYVNVSTLRQSLYPTDKVHGVITAGGDAANVIPDHTAMTWYVRAATTDRLEHVRAKVEACFEGAATATGATLTVTPRGHTYLDMRIDPVMAELFSANAAALGRPMGNEPVEDRPAAGSTDMGNVSHVVPSIHPMLDIGCSPATYHQKEFAAHTVMPGGERALRDGALAMAWTVIDLATGNRWAELGGS